MNIELVQGDTSKVYRFKRKNKNEVITTLPQKMWLTFKNSCCSKECVLQKTLENGGITYSEIDNYYRFQLKSEDTCELPYGDYGFDIAIINENGEKKTLKRDCVLKIVDHYTHKCNEV